MIIYHRYRNLTFRMVEKKWKSYKKRGREVNTDLFVHRMKKTDNRLSISDKMPEIIRKGCRIGRQSRGARLETREKSAVSVFCTTPTCMSRLWNHLGSHVGGEAPKDINPALLSKQRQVLIFFFVIVAISFSKAGWSCFFSKKRKRKKEK